MRWIDRRQFLTTASIGVAGLIAGCSGSDETGSATETTQGPHTPSAEAGNATVATSKTVASAESQGSATVPIAKSVSGEQLESVSVAHDEGFDLSAIEGEDVTVYIGKELGTVREATVTDVSVEDDRELVVTLDGSMTLSEDQQVVVEYDGVRLPERVGEYAVTVTVNETASETGIVEVTDSAGTITSSFEQTMENWRVEGDAQGGSSFPNHEEDGGNPGRCLSAVDDVQGGVWYWVAPTAFTGDKSAYAGGTLSYDIYQNNRSNQFRAQDVLLEGAETTLAYSYGGEENHPETDWTSYDVPLTATEDWTVDSLDGEQATDDQMQAVLSDLQKLTIRGEFVSGSDTGYLDNPTLTPPE